MMSNLSSFHTSVAGVLVLALNVSAAEVLDPAKPDRGNDEWRMRHAVRVADVRSHTDKLDVLFIGDSITGGWLNIGKAFWEKELVPLRAVNIGIAGSQTSHILWQFENGAIDNPFSTPFLPLSEPHFSHSCAPTPKSNFLGASLNPVESRAKRQTGFPGKLGTGAKRR